MDVRHNAIVHTIAEDGGYVFKEEPEAHHPHRFWRGDAHVRHERCVGYGGRAAKHCGQHVRSDVYIVLGEVDEYRPRMRSSAGVSQLPEEGTYETGSGVARR